MSLRLETLQIARLAPSLLHESSDLVHAFIISQMNEDGGFKNREGASDIYYTVFGIESLVALRTEPPAQTIGPYLEGFGEGDGLDLAHLASLARCMASLRGGPVLEARRSALLPRLVSFRSLDGGFHNHAGSPVGTVYACFLALGAYQDLGGELSDPQGVLDCVRGLETADGAYSNDRAVRIGSTPATAAAVGVLRSLGAAQRPEVGAWLEARCHHEGGFFAMPGAPVPDLLSTAVALHALASLEHPIDRLREPCLDFIDSLWTNRGSFHGSWADDHLDAEYTYYGLLALGHLSV